MHIINVFWQLKEIDIETVADQCEEKSTEQGTKEDEDELDVDSPEVVVCSDDGSEGANVEDDIFQLKNADMIKSVRTCFHIENTFFIDQWRKLATKHKDKIKCEENEVDYEDQDDQEKKLLGPTTEYEPQEEVVLETKLEVSAGILNQTKSSNFQGMSVPRALGTIGLANIRGLESSQEGALLLANQVSRRRDLDLDLDLCHGDFNK